MKISKRTALALISGLLIGSAFVPPRAALAKDSVVVAEATPIKSVAPSLFGVLSSVIEPSAVESRQGKTNCEVLHLYSPHDVVGDPQTCIMNRVVFGASGVAP
jgi:hypothetical protein